MMKGCSRYVSYQLARNHPLSGSNKRNICAGIFIFLALAGLVVGAYFYGVSKLSASSLTIQAQTVSEKYRSGSLGHAEVDVIVKVTSTGLYDLNVSRVTFELQLDNTTFPLVQASGSTFSEDQSMFYTLTFNSNDALAVNHFSQAKDQAITVSITAWVSAGMYSGWVTASDSRIWTFQFFHYTNQ